MKINPIVCKSILLLLLISFNMQAQKLKKNQFNNPLALQRADPFVTKAANGTYYFIATAPEYDRIEIRSSKTINGIKEAKPVVVWRKHDNGIMGTHIWAPELHRIEGKWYIYFAAASTQNKWDIHKYALSNPSEDPTQGTWTEEGQIKSKVDIFSLDATTFEHKGQRYMIWVDRAKKDNTGLFIAKMSSPTTLEEIQTVITQPDYPWEMHKYKVNEGPAVLIRNGKVFVTFSASATDATYCLGLLWADIDANLLEATSWHKLPEPVFYTNEKFKRYGPGHNSFTTSEDGKTDIMIYHARDYKEIIGDALTDPNRHTRARVLQWTKDGMPDFGQDLDDNEMALKKPIKKK